MLINFAHPIFNPPIECSTISSEGYEISNLRSSDAHLSQKGFLAERFISGPISITIKFICPISIKYIIIWSKVSNQKSLGFELSSYSSTKHTTAKFALGVIKNDAEGIIFHKEGYKLDLNEHSPEIKSFFRGTFYRSKHYENTEAIQLKIFKSHYVPAVKKIEIWGEPHHLCDSEIKLRVTEKWHKLKQSRSVPTLINNESSSVETCTPHITDETVPDEFYDQITHEIMALPMILPSGKLIDYRTLEKFQAEEAKWGRLPSDPFTGLLFTESRKPVVAASLKSQIDYYLLKNSDSEQVKILPRRLGLKGENFKKLDFRISKIVDDKHSNKRKFCSVESKEDKISNKNLKTFVSEDNSNRFKMVGIEDIHLKTMLEKTLHNLPSFLNDKNTEKEDLVISCSRCCGTNQLYKLPCIHIFCRLCLRVNENSCNLCKIKFSFAEVDKIHIVKSRDAL